MTAVGDDTGSTAEGPIGAYEFMQRAPYMHASNPVWDERGLLMYRRSGTRAFRVTVMGSSRIWSGLYHARTLHPRVFLLLLLRSLLARALADQRAHFRLPPHDAAALAPRRRRLRRLVVR